MTIERALKLRSEPGEALYRGNDHHGIAWRVERRSDGWYICRRPPGHDAWSNVGSTGTREDAGRWVSQLVDDSPRVVFSTRRGTKPRPRLCGGDGPESLRRIFRDLR